ncbi:MAG TPA: winged helix-turn-helix domain-containing protein, partial [Blastocatellia bacterium]|nr:winged helix-turn-helix domain-containing protein [Blastocatellia bacterium]
MKQDRTARFYEFGPFLVDAVKCVLTREGEAVPLSLKAFETLLVLIQHRGQVLEKDEILSLVWPDTVVEENNLARNISALRKALDEHPNEHQYILTVPGRGYRFVADVREVASENGSSDHAAETSKVRSREDLSVTSGGRPLAEPDLKGGSTKSERRPRVVMMAAAVLLVGVVFTAIVLSVVPRLRAVEHPPAQRKLWQLTFDAGLEGEPTWSPDGRLVAYSSDRDGNFDIWVQPVGEGNAVRVSSSPSHDWQPDWAPEGNRIVFRSERDGGGLYIVPVLGGNERKVSSFGYRPRWSPDGTQILFYSWILRHVVEIPKVYVVGLNGEAPREVLTEFLTRFTSVRVAWHPDGRRISLWGNHRERGWTFWTMPLDGGTPVESQVDARLKEQLKDSDLQFTDFQWSPTGRALYLEGVSRRVRNLWRVEVDPATLRWTPGLERLTTGTGLDTDIAISRDGKKIAFTARTERTRLWSLPFDAASGKVEGPGQPVSAAGKDAFFPDLSADGESLVFVTQRAGQEEVWEKSLKTGRETLLRAPDESTRVIPRWSRDGSHLVYSRLRPNPENAEIQRTIVIVAASGGEERTLTSLGTSIEVPLDWSGDGEWVLASSERQTPGRSLICAYPVSAVPHAESKARVITSHPEDNLWQARFSPDNRWISFCAARVFEAGVSTIYVVPAAGGEWKRITEGRYFDDKPRWSPDGKTLYFVSNRTGFFNVWGIRFDVATGQSVGEPFRVTNFESPGQMILSDVRTMEL